MKQTFVGTVVGTEFRSKLFANYFTEKYFCFRSLQFYDVLFFVLFIS